MNRNSALDNNDHIFAQWLRAHEWQSTQKEGNRTQFFDGDGDMIAVVIYDNTALTTKVYTGA